METPEEVNFETLYDEMYWRMLRLAYTIVHDGEEARDVVQNVFTRLLEGRTGLRAGVEPAYLLTCTRNACLNLLARKRLEERVGGDIAAGLYDTSEANEERWEAVERAIEQVLSPQDRRVLLSCYEEGRSYRETAEQLGISVSAVNKHIVQALRKLRRRLRTITLVAALLLTGIVVAMMAHRMAKAPIRTGQPAPTERPATGTAQPQQTEEPTAALVQFTDARLDAILAQMAAHYGLSGVRFLNPDSRELHLYLRWNPSAPCTEAIGLLNRFDRVSIRLQADTFIVE